MTTRVAQEALEVIVSPIPPIRVAQEAIEVVVLQVPPIRLAQEALEVIVQPIPPFRVTQEAIEVLTNTPLVDLISVSPNPITLGQTLTLTGTNFHRVNLVAVDGVGMPFTVVNSTTITVELPILTIGQKSIYVEFT